MPKTHGATSARVNERVAEMMLVLSNRPTAHKSILHREFTVRWHCHWKTVDNIIARARGEIRKRLDRSKQDFQSESLAFYEAKANDPKATVGEQIRARQRIDELLGLDAPKQMRVAGAMNAPPISVETKNPCEGLPEERLRFIASGGLRSLLGNGDKQEEPTGNGHGE